MFETIELPMWFVVIAAVFAAIAALERALIPSVAVVFPAQNASRGQPVKRAFGPAY